MLKVRVRSLSTAVIAFQVTSYDIYDNQKQPEAAVEVQPLIAVPPPAADSGELLPTDVVPVAASVAAGKDSKGRTAGRQRTDSRRTSALTRASECAARL